MNFGARQSFKTPNIATDPIILNRLLLVDLNEEHPKAIPFYKRKQFFHVCEMDPLFDLIEVHTLLFLFHSHWEQFDCCKKCNHHLTL